MLLFPCVKTQLRKPERDCIRQRLIYLRLLWLLLENSSLISLKTHSHRHTEEDFIKMLALNDV